MLKRALLKCDCIIKQTASKTLSTRAESSMLKTAIKKTLRKNH